MGVVVGMKNTIALKRILIAIDESTYSEKALSYGCHLAKKLNAKVALVHVSELPMIPGYVGNTVVGEAPSVVPELLSVEQEAAKKLLERATKTCGEQNEVYTFNRIGLIKDEILAVADEWKADLLILGTHGRTGLDHFIVGSIAESVARKAHCPVLIIPNKEN